MLDVVAALLARGADIDERDPRHGSTPIVEAAMEGRADVVELFLVSCLSHNPSVSVCDSDIQSMR